MSSLHVVRATAPGRAGILGNPTDGYGGCVISCTIPFQAEAVFQPNKGGFVVKLGDHEADLSDPAAWVLHGDPLDLARCVLTHLGPERGMAGKLDIRSDIPRQAGLAGSTALIAVVLAALDAARTEDEKPGVLAERVRAIERWDLGVTCGFQDQYSLVYGGLNFLDFAGKEQQGTAPPDPYATVEPLVMPPDVELPFVIAHTGVAHDSGGVHQPLRARWEAGDERVVHGYRRIAQLCRLGKDLFAAREWPALGALMDENHAIQRDLGGSGAENERLIAAAKADGAYGAKLAGAGHGGTIIAAHPDPAALAARLSEAGATTVFRPRRAPGITVETIP